MPFEIIFKSEEQFQESFEKHVVQLIKKVRETEATEVTIQGVSNLLGSQKDFLLKEMDARLVHLEKIECDDSEFEKPFVQMIARNKLLSLYQVDKSKIEGDPWNVLMDGHFKNMLDNGCIDGVRNIFSWISTKADYDEAEKQIVIIGGLKWFEEYHKYLHANRSVIQKHGIPFKELASNIPLLSLGEQLKSTINYLQRFNQGEDSQDEPYLPFLKYNFVGSVTESENIPVLIQELIAQLPSHYDGMIRIEGRGDNWKEKTFDKDDMDAILNAVKNKRGHYGFVTKLELKITSGDKEAEAKYSELQNLISQNRRAFNKAKRLGHYRPEAPQHEETQQVLVKPEIEHIRKAKRGGSDALANLKVAQSFTQQAEEQEEQQQQQQQQQELVQQADARYQRSQNPNEFDPAKQKLNKNQFEEKYGQTIDFRAEQFSSRGVMSRGEVWDRLIVNDAGKFENRIKYISESAAQILINNPDIFWDGANEHNMPAGFALRSLPKEKGYVLDYDESLKLLDIPEESIAHEDLKAKFSLPYSNRQPEIYGNHDQFGITEEEFELVRKDNHGFKAIQINQAKNIAKRLGISVERASKQIEAQPDPRLEILHKMMKHEDRPHNISSATLLEDGYKSIWKIIQNSGLLNGCGDIVYMEGAQGLKVLFDKFVAYRNQYGEEALDDFIKNFTKGNRNRFSDLISNENLDAIDGIMAMSPDEYAWWSSLVKQHSDYDNRMNATDLLKAFKTFQSKLKVIDLNLEIRGLCPVENCKNMKVALDRILLILNNSSNPIEQFDHLRGLDYSSTGAYYAMLHDGYRLVTKDMALNGISNNNNHKPAMFSILGKGDNYSELRQEYFREIGCLKYRDEYEHYINLLRRIDSYNEYYNKQDKITQDKMIFPATVVKLLTFATAHEGAVGKNGKEVLSNLIERCKSLHVEDPTSIEVYIVKYLSMIRSGDNSPILNQMEAILKFHVDIDNLSKARDKERAAGSEPDEGYLSDSLETWSMFSCPNASIYDKYGKPYIDAIEMLYKSEAGTIKSLQFIEYIDNLEKHLYFKDSSRVELQRAVFNLSTKINIEDYSNEKRDSLWFQIETFYASNPEKVNLFLRTINAIDPLHKQTTKLPTLSEIEKALQVLMVDENMNENTMFVNVCRQEGFKQCAFKSIRSEVDMAAIKALLDKYRKDIKEFLDTIPGINYQEDDLNDPQKIINLIPGGLIAAQILNKIYTTAKETFYTDISHLVDQALPNLGIEALIRHQLDNQAISKYDSKEALLSSMAQMAPGVAGIPTYHDHVKRLIETLKDIKKSNPANITKVTSALALPGTINVPLAQLNLILGELQTLDRKRFPVNILQSILSHPMVVQDKISNWPEISTSLNAIKVKELSLSQAGVAIDITLQLSAFDRFNRQAFVKFLEIRETNPKIFDTLLLMQADALRTDLSYVMLSEMVLFEKNLSEHVKDSAVQMKLIASLSEHSDQSREILTKLNSIKDPEQFRQVIVCLCHTQLSRNPDINVELIDLLTPEKLNGLQGLDPDYPYPNADTLKNYLSSNENIEQFKLSIQNDHAKKLSAIREASGSTAEVNRVINGLVNLETGGPLPYAQRLKLYEDLHYINAIGQQRAISVDPTNPNSKRLPICDMTQTDIKRLMTHYKAIIQGEGEEAAKYHARLVYIALIREAMLRTSDKKIYPHSTQILSLLNTMRMGTYNLSEIQTGQGKSVTAALYASMQALEGTVDICTSNMALAREGFEENKKFFEYQGLKSNLIGAGSDASEYCKGGINYSDVSQLALFLARMQIEGQAFLGKQCLILDEADYTLLDDTTEYRYAKSLEGGGSAGESPYAWAYEAINDFIDSEKGKSDQYTRTQDILNCRSFLESRATPSQFKQMSNDSFFSDDKLDELIDSAFTAKKLAEPQYRDKMWTIQSIKRDGEDLSVVRIISNDRVSPVAQWSKGVYQLFHDRMNHDPTIKAQGFHHFPIDAEKVGVAAISSKNFIDHYKKSGGMVWGMTGTIGSHAEREEHRHKYGFKMSGVPPHQTSQRIDQKPILVDSNDKHKEKIFQEVLKRIRSKDKMPTLIICKDAEAARELHAFLNDKLSRKAVKQYPLTLQLCNGVDQPSRTEFSAASTKSQETISSNDTETEEQQIVKRAGMAGTITISTPMLGRGTDFKPLAVDATAHKHGLFVVHAAIDSERTAWQVVGRSGRQGAPGETMTIISHEMLDVNHRIASQSVQAHIDALRDKRLISQKDQRALGEFYSDVRNSAFIEMLRIQNAIDSYCQKELLKSGDESRDERTSDQIKSELMRDWVKYMDDLDKAWSALLDKPQLNIMNATDELVKKHAGPNWNRMAEKYTSIVDTRFTDTHKLSVSFYHIPVTRPRPTSEKVPCIPLPQRLNAAMLYIDQEAGINSETKFIVYRNEIDKQIQDLNKLLASDKTAGKKGFPPVPLGDVEAAYKALLDKQFYDPTKFNLMQPHYQAIYVNLNLTLQKMNALMLEEYKELCEDLLTQKQNAHETHYLKTNIHSVQQQRSLTSLMRKQAVNIEQAVVEKGVAGIKHEIEIYQKKWGLSKERKDAVDELLVAIQKNNTSKIFDALLRARSSAIKTDSQSSPMPFQFATGGRFQQALNKMHDHLIAVAKPGELGMLLKYQEQDLRLLIHYQMDKSKDPASYEPILQALSQNDFNSALSQLEAINKASLSGRAAEYQKHIKDKMNSIDCVLEMMSKNKLDPKTEIAKLDQSSTSAINPSVKDTKSAPAKQLRAQTNIEVGSSQAEAKKPQEAKQRRVREKGARTLNMFDKIRSTSFSSNDENKPPNHPDPGKGPSRRRSTKSGGG